MNRTKLMDSINKLLKDITTLMNNPQYKIGNADIDRLKDTLSYIKNYCTMMEAGKAVSSALDVKKDIEDARKKLESEKQKIKERKQEISEEAVYVGEAPQMHAFDYKRKEIVEEQIKAQNEHNAKILKKLELKEQIIDEQLTKLAQMEASLSNPKKFLDTLMPEEMKNNMQEFQSLVNMCAVATSHNYHDVQEFHKKPIFEHDGNTFEEGYSINEPEAKEFIQFIRNESLMGELSSMFEQEKELDEERAQLTRERDVVISNNRTNIDIYTTLMSNPKFEEAIRDINEFNDNEPKQTGFPVPTSKLKIINKIRQLFPGKMFPHEKRKMQEFYDKQKIERENYAKNGSQKIRERIEVDEDYKQVIDYFSNLHGNDGMHSLLTYGHLDSEFIRESAEKSLKRVSEINGRIEDIQVQKENMRENLSNEAKAVIEAHGDDNIRTMTEEYYALEQNEGSQIRYGENTKSDGHPFNALSRVGASMCLELLLERGNIPNEVISRIAGLVSTNLPDLDSYVKSLTQKSHDMVKKIMEQQKTYEQTNEMDER